MTLAEAKTKVKEVLKAKGIKLSHVKYTDFLKAAKELMKASNS